MLSPSDFNNAVPQFTNGNYASNPINPQYIAEPDAVSYNRGTEPLQTLPAQWWNWFLNKFTGRFNKVNVYVKNIFNELAQVLSIFNITPDGTEQTPTTSQLKTVFECCYPEYVKTAASLVGTETTVNGHPLSSNVTVTRSDLGLGTSATVNTGTAVGCIPTVGTALGTTNNNILVTDATGKLKPSGITVGTAAGCAATAFRSCTWTPTCVACAGQSYCVMDYYSNATPLYIGYACAGLTCAQVTNLAAFSTNYTTGKTVIKDVSKANVQSWLGLGTAAYCAATAFRASSWTPSLVNCSCYSYIDTYTASADRGVVLTCAVTAAGQYQTLGPSVTCKFTFNPATGEVKAKTFTGALAGCACCAGRDGSGCAFGTAARYACGCFRPSTWTPSCVSCSHCSDYSEITYNWRPIFYSSDMKTVNCCNVCLWAVDGCHKYICNKSNCGVLVSYFHYINNSNKCSDIFLLKPYTCCYMGNGWNLTQGSEFQCICVYMFK